MIVICIVIWLLYVLTNTFNWLRSYGAKTDSLTNDIVVIIGERRLHCFRETERAGSLLGVHSEDVSLFTVADKEIALHGTSGMIDSLQPVVLIVFVHESDTTRVLVDFRYCYATWREGRVHNQLWSRLNKNNKSKREL